MAARKLFVVFAILAGLFALQGTTVEALPREKARIEVVVGFEVHRNLKSVKQESSSKFFISKTLKKAQVLQPKLLVLLISSIQHHSSL